MKKINKGFTLVELIVVITILAVLWTIAFVSFQWYASNSRDSVRLTDLSNISKAIKVKLAAWETLLMPDKSVEIQTNWEVLNYQWLMWEKILSHYWISNGWVDPLDLRPYTYAINKNKNKYQVLTFLENGDYVSFLNHKVYADNKQKFHKSVWDTLGILLDSDNNPIINTWALSDVDINTTTNNYNVVTSNSVEISSWTSSHLTQVLNFRIDAEKNCNNLLLNWLSKWNGIYTIEPNWSDPIRVYCDMSSGNWGWTLLITTNPNSLAFWNNNDDINEWYNSTKLGTLPKSDSSVYNKKDYKSEAYWLLKTNKIRLCLEDSSQCYSFNHNKNISLFDFFDKWITYKDAWYNNYSTYNYSFNEDKITDFFGKIWKTVYKAPTWCAWLWINKPAKDWAIWLTLDANYGCRSTEWNELTYDDGSLWIGINSCADESPVGLSACTSRWTNAKSWVLRNIIDSNWATVHKSIVWAWAVWAQ